MKFTIIIALFIFTWLFMQEIWIGVRDVKEILLEGKK